jgi:hypothetical protein
MIEVHGDFCTQVVPLVGFELRCRDRPDQLSVNQAFGLFSPMNLLQALNCSRSCRLIRRFFPLCRNPAGQILARHLPRLKRLPSRAPSDGHWPATWV